LLSLKREQSKCTAETAVDAGGPPFRFERDKEEHGCYVSIPIARRKKERGREELQCPICGRKADEQGYCRLHATVRNIIIKKYDRWRKAMEISWKEYLSEIAKNPLAGEWVREVAQHLIETEDQRNVKNG
jgi:hypothetical protein